MEVMIKFAHGLGDAVQLTRVLHDVLESNPGIRFDVAAWPGKQTLFRSIARNVYTLGIDEPVSGYDKVMVLEWPECDTTYWDAPGTKASRCLEQEFHVPPTMSGYHVTVSDSVQERVNRAVKPWGRFGLLHYEGNTASGSKNLNHWDAGVVIKGMREAGITPVLLDWDNRSPHCSSVINPNENHPVWGGIGTGDGEALVAMINQAVLFVGVDSGPLHCAMATKTPTVAVWTHHHPINYADYNPSVLHLLPANHRQNIRGDAAVGLQAFNRYYRHETYLCLAESILGGMSDVLNPTNLDMIPYRSLFIRRNMAGQDIVIVHDVMDNDTYRIGILGEPHKSGRQVVVDVGAHIGTFAVHMAATNPDCRIACVEACPENIPCLTKNVEHINATVFAAACTYDTECILLNAVMEGTESTGGSIACSLDEAQQRLHSNTYWLDKRKLPTVSLEEVAKSLDSDFIDILKLDCEGSEFSILENTSMRDRIGMIVGEYHGRSRWNAMRGSLFPDWPYSESNNGDLGTFHMRNPVWTGCWNP